MIYIIDPFQIINDDLARPDDADFHIAMIFPKKGGIMKYLRARFTRRKVQRAFVEDVEWRGAIDEAITEGHIGERAVI